MLSSDCGMDCVLSATIDFTFRGYSLLSFTFRNSSPPVVLFRPESSTIGGGSSATTLVFFLVVTEAESCWNLTRLDSNSGNVFFLV